MCADEYYDTFVSTDYSLDTFDKLDTNKLGILDEEEMILAFAMYPIGIDICKKSDNLYEAFVYYMDGTGDYIPLEMTYTLDEINKKFK